MSPRESRDPTTVGAETCNTAEIQDKDFKMPFMDMIKVLK